jgi:Kae1-associated kinase Bud32
MTNTKAKRIVLARGAESIIEQDGDVIIKTRPSKTYRIAQIDEKFTKLRTRSETKILLDLAKRGVCVPIVLESDSNVIKMQHIIGPQVKLLLNRKTAKSLGAQIGVLLAQIHSCGIIHGDYTTSNILYCGDKVYAIDFGLSYYSQKPEDRAVDLHIMRQAISAYHFDCEELLFKAVLDGYAQLGEDVKTVLGRFAAVEKRGKNKH